MFSDSVIHKQTQDGDRHDTVSHRIAQPTVACRNSRTLVLEDGLEHAHQLLRGVHPQRGGDGAAAKPLLQRLARAELLASRPHLPAMLDGVVPPVGAPQGPACGRGTGGS